MSLRVLLADESDTIKKVFQLALQDLNIEIKTVQSGLDVINVAQSFKPQIIFADVLLQKRNGYEMCLEIKQNSTLSSIPVILMWSSFMELDQEQFKRSQAEDQLEKPFDADLLRNLVKKYVPTAASNPLSQFLKFPKSIAQGTQPKAPKATPASPPPIKEKAENEEASEFNLNAILGDLAPEPTADAVPPSFSDDALEMPEMDSVTVAEFDQYKIEPPTDNLEKFETFNLTNSKSSENQFTDDFVNTKNEAVMNEFDNIKPTQLDHLFQSPSSASVSRTEIPIPQRLQEEPDEMEKIVVQTKQTAQTKNSAQTKQAVVSQTTGLNDQEIEAIVRAHTEEYIKNQLQHSLMDIVEKIVREELNKVLDEEVRLKQELQDDNP